MNKERNNFRRSQDVAGVTVIWNSLALPLLADVDVAVREVVEDKTVAADVGMSWSPAEIVFTDTEESTSEDNGVNEVDNDVVTVCIESTSLDDMVVVIIVGGEEHGGDECEIFVVFDDDGGGERRAWYQSRFCSNVSSMALASG